MAKSNNSEPLEISDLEEQLKHDSKGHYRDQLMSELFDQMVELKKCRNKGASPDDYQQIDTLVLALSAAGETVAKTWKKHHKHPTPTK